MNAPAATQRDLEIVREMDPCETIPQAIDRSTPLGKVFFELRVFPGQSARAIAARCGVSLAYVRFVQQEMGEAVLRLHDETHDDVVDRGSDSEGVAS